MKSFELLPAEARRTLALRELKRRGLSLRGIPSGRGHLDPFMSAEGLELQRYVEAALPEEEGTPDFDEKCERLIVELVRASKLFDRAYPTAYRDHDSEARHAEMADRLEAAVREQSL